jgi:hypothetical protein
MEYVDSNTDDEFMNSLAILSLGMLLSLLGGDLLRGKLVAV